MSGRRSLPSSRYAWIDICENIDYVPVFDLALRVLYIIVTSPPKAQEPVMAPLLKAVKETRHLEGHDLSGRLFHTLLTDAKFTGAYYTSVPAATMLARARVPRLAASRRLERPRVPRRPQRRRSRLRHGNPADGRRRRGRAPPQERGRQARRRAPQGHGRAGPARLRRAAHSRAFRRHQPRHAQPQHPVRPHEPLRHGARSGGIERLPRLARLSGQR